MCQVMSAQLPINTWIFLHIMILHLLVFLLGQKQAKLKSGYVKIG